jgi:pSer/pThr/pTyr-binding forkhead associated (FHA) protein
VILFKFLSGKMAGGSWTTRRFPVRIGRVPSADLQLEEPGVWDQHLEISLDPKEGFVATISPGALATVNGHPLERAVLHNGDTIQMGAMKLQFWLAASRQAGLRIREWLTWVAIAAISLGQVWLIYWLLE